VAVNLVLTIPALVEQRELEQSADVGALGGEGDEDGDVGGVVLGVLAVRVEVYRPLVPSHRERLAGDVFPHSDPLRQGVSLYHELVRPVHRLRHRPRTRPRRQHAAAVAPARGVHLTRDGGGGGGGQSTRSA